MHSSRSVRRAGLCLILAVATGAAADGQSPNLREAVRAGNTQAVRALLQKRDNVNAADADGTTALHWAARGNDAETVKALLKAGANANPVNNYGLTPLFLAATVGNPVITQALLDAGANPNLRLKRRPPYRDRSLVYRRVRSSWGRWAGCRRRRIP